MIKNKFLTFLIFIFVFVSGCGFEPIYKTKKDFKFNINIISAEGDNELNNFIINNLNKKKFEQSNKDLDIRIYTEYKKEILLKNASGTTTDFKLKLDANFITKIDEKENSIKISESFEMKKNNNTFDEEYYERSIKETLSSKIVEKFLSRVVFFE